MNGKTLYHSRYMHRFEKTRAELVHSIFSSWYSLCCSYRCCTFHCRLLILVVGIPILYTQLLDVICVPYSHFLMLDYCKNRSRDLRWIQSMFNRFANTKVSWFAYRIQTFVSTVFGSAINSAYPSYAMNIF